MTTFWKGFAIFWIIFLIWYLTGGPQRVNINGAKPTTTFDLNSVDSSASSTTESSSIQTPEKSFSDKPKTNTINVAN